MDTTLSRPPAGQLLDGRYRVEAWLAHGGMATVYLGTDIRLDRKVALKIAHPDLAGDEEFIRRFMGEARSVARLSSPHVVAVYDQGSDGQFLYLAMEYVHGQTLRELLRERGRLGPREALDIIEGVLAGLASAHEAGIVHRDVKPENVLLTTGNLVKVADFGLARAAAAAGRTKTGTIIGTAAYLAPEQVSRSSSDARTDVYATGIMLFELLTGTQPHAGGTPLDVAYKHVNDVVPAPSSLVPGLPPALDALVALATSREPELRPADAGQFLRAITEVRRGRPIAGSRTRGQHAAPDGGYPHEDSDTGDHRSLGAGLPPAAVLLAGGAAGGLPAAGSGLPGAASGFPAAGSGLPGGLGPGRPAASDPFGSSPPSGVHHAASPASGSSTADGRLTAQAWPDANRESHTGEPGTAWPDARLDSHSGEPAARSWPDASPGSATSGLALPGPGPIGLQPGSSAQSGSTVPGAAAPVPALPWPDTGPGDLAPSRPRRGGAHSGPASSRRRTGGPEDLILPPARIQQTDHGGTNHTLIVSAGHLTDDGHEGPERRWSRRARGYRSPGEPMLQRLLFSRRFIYLSGGLAVLLAIILVTWWLTAGQYTTVPAVRGMAVSVARTELTNLGFVVKTGPGEHSSTVAKGEVVQTKPAIGSKPRQGSTVQLIVSLGPLKFPVPQVTGMKLADAEAALKKAGLKPGRVSATTSQTIANGIVISTNPVAGVSWPQTAPVAITVSDGQPLQDFVGQQLQAAESAATSAGYALNPVADKQSTQPAGTITSQSPAPGTPVSPNEVVTVHYSNGPPMTDIPNVQGMNENQATAKLTAAGFNVTVNTLGPGHRVVSYSPTGQAPEGSTITLNVGFLFNLMP